MRLDHLLSKEHVQAVWSVPVYSSQKDGITCQVVTALFGVDGAHGWNIDIVARGTVFSSVHQLAGRNEGCGGAGLCTLLGPEGPGPNLLIRFRTLGPGTSKGVSGSNGSWSCFLQVGG